MIGEVTICDFTDTTVYTFKSIFESNIKFQKIFKRYFLTSNPHYQGIS